jgi:hypothetical protein
MAAPTNVRISLTSAGVCSGPVNIFSDADGFTTPIATGISIASLTGFFGFLTPVPAGTTIIRVRNANFNCQNYEQVLIT